MSTDRTTYRKTVRTGPEAYTAWEAAGLRWLADAGGAPVVEVLAVQPGVLELERLESVPPGAEAAEDFGRALAATHAAGADGFGAPPSGWDGDGWIGPAGDVLDLPLRPTDDWGVFYAEQRVRPLTDEAVRRGHLDVAGRSELHRLADRVAGGAFDTGDSPSRVHGDLWSGNVLWTPSGAVLIDPAAHGGHRETDLAALGLFGAPHLDRVLSAYDEAAPLADGWRERADLHRLHLLLVHLVLFGRGYLSDVLDVARRYG